MELGLELGLKPRMEGSLELWLLLLLLLWLGKSLELLRLLLLLYLGMMVKLLLGLGWKQNLGLTL